jgi:hypothetical protein
MATTTMKTYWDLGERERAELTDERLAQLERIELMSEGVLEVEPFVPEQEQPAPEPDVEVFDVKVGYSVIATLRTMDAARAFIELRPVVVNSHWSPNGVTIQHENAADELDVGVRRIHSRAQYGMHAATLIENAKVRERNAAAQKAFEDAMEARSLALATLRQDLAGCRARAAHYARVVRVWKEYTATAGGDAEVAARFLAKAFSRQDITAAAEWYGVYIPDPNAPVPA